MSNNIDDELPPELAGLEDEPEGDWVNYAVVEIYLPDGQVMMTIDVEVCADRCLSGRELDARVRMQVAPQLAILCDSPRFKARMGGECRIGILGTGCQRGC